MVDQPIDNAPANSLAGSALGVFPPSVLALKFQGRAGSQKGAAAQYRENQETDHVNDSKFPDPSAGFAYLASGAISITQSLGEFVFGNTSPKPTPGALYLNQGKSQLSSTASTTVIGSPMIKTLTGLMLNPASVRRPSSALTPDRGWLASIFPTFTRFNVAEWATVAAASALMNELLAALFQRTSSTGTTVREDRKDLGTLIVDNQDFELSILEGDI